MKLSKEDSDIVRDAIALVQQDGVWIPRFMATDGEGFVVSVCDNRARCFCMEGAIYRKFWEKNRDPQLSNSKLSSISATFFSTYGNFMWHVNDEMGKDAVIAYLQDILVED